MTTEEFSNEFDTLLNSYIIAITGEQSSKFNIGFDEYEKSVFLTQAQEDIIQGLYNGKLSGEPFEYNEELRRHLDSLVQTIKLTPAKEVFIGVDTNSRFFKLPNDVWFITYEQAVVENNIIKVVPTRQDEWHRIKNNPFKMPSKNKVIRLDSGEGMIELIAHSPSITEYLIKYVSKPTPIILVDLPDDLSINGEHNITECQINTALHRLILERAVQLAYRRIPQASK
jgi:hypothetical protein